MVYFFSVDLKSLSDSSKMITGDVMSILAFSTLLPDMYLNSFCIKAMVLVGGVELNDSLKGNMVQQDAFHT